MAITKFPLTDFVLEMNKCPSVNAEHIKCNEQEYSEVSVQEVVTSVKNQAPAVSVINSCEFVKYSKEEIEALKSDAMSEGMKIAKMEHEEEQHKVQEKNFLLLSAIMSRIDEIGAVVTSQYDEMIKDFGALLNVFLRKVVGSVAERFSTDSILDFLRKNMHKVCTEPSISIKVSTKDYEAIFDCMNEITSMCNPNTKIVLLAKDDIAQGDCVIDFDRGAISRNIDILLEDLDSVLDSYLSKTGDA